MQLCMFFVGAACSILMSQTNSNVYTYEAGGMFLDVEKSKSISKDGHGEQNLKYIVRNSKSGFEVEFPTAKQNLDLAKKRPGTIRVGNIVDGKKGNTYLDISIRGRSIEDYSITDYFLVDDDLGTRSKLELVAGPPL